MKNSNTEAHEFTAVELGKVFGMTGRRVGQLSQDGIIPRLKNGKYSIDAIAAFIQHMKDEAKPKTEISKMIEEEKHRQLKRENDIAEGLVAPVSVLTDVLEHVVSITVPIMESLPLLIKRNWPEVTGDQITLIKKAVVECRNALADAKI